MKNEDRLHHRLVIGMMMQVARWGTQVRLLSGLFGMLDL